MCWLHIAAEAFSCPTGTFPGKTRRFFVDDDVIKFHGAAAVDTFTFFDAFVRRDGRPACGIYP